MSPRQHLLLAVALGWAACGCEERPRSKSSAAKASASAARKATTPPVFVKAAASGDVAATVRSASTAAHRDGGVLIVYVGATWCEPCERFKVAVKRGELDQQLPGVTFLEFDLDRDKVRLEAAGYSSRMIPLFCRPDAQGRGTSRRIFGSIKGPGAVANILPRLKRLLKNGDN